MSSPLLNPTVNHATTNLQLATNADAQSSDQAITDPASALASEADVPAPSKRSLKRAAKNANFQAKKMELRAREKIKKKERMTRLKEESGQGSEEASLELQRKLTRQKETKSRKAKFRKGLTLPEDQREGWWNGRVVVDLGFDELMIDTEIKSMSTQISYLYNIHTVSHTPFNSLLFTHLDGRLSERLYKAHFDNSRNRWSGTEWWDGQELDRLWLPPNEKAEDFVPLGDVAFGRSSARKEDVVYLTADSENEIDALEEGTTYVIGGIVDRNRYKNLCLDKATRLGIRTARLPIGTYLASMPTRKVLTVNQVFDILTSWVEFKDWEKALTKVMPIRKMVESHKKAKKEKRGRPENKLPGGTDIPGDEGIDITVDGDDNDSVDDDETAEETAAREDAEMGMSEEDERLVDESVLVSSEADEEYLNNQ
ncbi:Uncharacterized conserved protein [Phaffia rhodozyma]|uniref:tRNA (guanine(9)-N1)-methyltransferase n=1 Tax=Phaffia rhodozyma TaxID=264483 RepID=A0A0F7SWV9_PHARH|nr:Uncharacterized conserved protein [Phaffia rhodozyma]